MTDGLELGVNGATAVVPGAASGIGAALAARLAARGARLVLADVAREPLEQVEHIGRRFVVVPDEWVDAIRERGERLGRGEPPTLPVPRN